MSSERKLLNPTALEFKPFSHNNSYIIPPPPLDVTPFNRYFSPAVGALPPLPSPPLYAYHPPAMTVYYHHFPLSFKLSPSYYLPKSDVIPCVVDEGLGLISSPTSVLSPPISSPVGEPSHDVRIIRSSARKKYGSSNPGRIRRRNLIWVKKKKKNTDESDDTKTITDDEITVVDTTPGLPNPNPIPIPIPIASYPYGDSTSLMIRNIPIRLSRGELMGLLDDHCRHQNERLSLSSSDAHTCDPSSQFDFLYLPIDFKRKGNLGYAFVNFTSWEGASRLYNSWKGTKWENCHYNSTKICQIHPAKFQGKELKRHFEASVFECEKDEYLPIEIKPARDGLNGEVTSITTVGRRVYRCLLPTST